MAVAVGDRRFDPFVDGGGECGRLAVYAGDVPVGSEGVERDRNPEEGIEDENETKNRVKYGGVLVVFSDSLRARSTFTVGDSKDENLHRSVTKPSWLDSPGQESQLFASDPLSARSVEELAVVEQSDSSYVEWQYRGRRRPGIGDVAKVVVDRNDPGAAELAARLKARGIRVEFSRSLQRG